MDNRAVLERLFASGGIALRISSLFEAAPAPLHTPRLWDRIEGMLLGLAIGDSLGNTTGPVFPDPRGEVWRNPITCRTPCGNRPVGLPCRTAGIWTLEQLWQMAAWRRTWRAALPAADLRLGRTIRSSSAATRTSRLWERAGVASAGNGALARIPHPGAPSPAAPGSVGDVALAMVTHNDPSTGSCLAWRGSSGR